MLRNNSKQSGESMKWILKKKKGGLESEGFAETEGFKPGMKEWVGDGIPNNSKGTFTLEVPGGYTINLWLCCGGWRCDADPRWK